MKLTIITICYNNAEGLKRTLDSVASQTCKDFEHVIVDGASTDGSVDIIREYDTLHQTQYTIHWISEKDTGIYNAMNKGIEIALGKRKVNEFNRSELIEDKNKGIRMATGEYLLFLNSGDALENPDVIANFISTEITADIATGIERMPDGKLVYPPKDEQLTYSFFYEDTLLHQSTFIRKDAFDRFGLYREGYRIVSDWEWFFRVIVREGASYQPLAFVVADFDGDGMSNDPSCQKLQENEREKVHQEILPRVRMDYIELLQLRVMRTEYEHLKYGKFKPILNILLKLKAIKNNEYPFKKN